MLTRKELIALATHLLCAPDFKAAWSAQPFIVRLQLSELIKDYRKA